MYHVCALFPVFQRLRTDKLFPQVRPVPYHQLNYLMCQQKIHPLKYRTLQCQMCYYPMVQRQPKN